MNFPSFEQIADFVQKTETAVATFTGAGSTLADDIKAALPAAESAVGTVLSVYFPEATILGFSPTSILSTVEAIADPTTGPQNELVNAFNELKAAVSGEPGPTDEQWAAFNAAADKAHGDWQAAVAARRASG